MNIIRCCQFCLWLVTSYCEIKITKLTLVLLYCLFLFFIHSKLELLTQFLASNDEKYAAELFAFSVI